MMAMATSTTGKVRALTPNDDWRQIQFAFLLTKHAH